MSLLSVDRSSAKKRADKEAARIRATLLFNDGDILSLLCEKVGRNQLRETLAAFLELHRINIGQFIEEKCSTLSKKAQDTLKDCGKYGNNNSNKRNGVRRRHPNCSESTHEPIGKEPEHSKVSGCFERKHLIIILGFHAHVCGSCLYLEIVAFLSRVMPTSEYQMANK